MSCIEIDEKNNLIIETKFEKIFIPTLKKLTHCRDKKI
jgi:hypothetical protein